MKCQISHNTGFDISYKLSPMETIYMKCQIQFSGENKKTSLSFAELAKRVVTVNGNTDKWTNAILQFHVASGGGQKITVAY